MIQTVTIRQQILQALQRVYDSMGFDDPLDLDRMEKELLAEFAPTAFALTPSDGFHEIALANGYVKLADDEIIAKRLTSGEICFGSVNVDQIARKFGYVKLQPGQVVVDEHPFTDDEVDYLLEAIEPMKCNDCNEQCRSKARGMCLYLNIRAKLETIKEARDE